MCELTWGDRQGVEFTEVYATITEMMRRVSDLNVQGIIAWFRWLPA